MSQAIKGFALITGASSGIGAIYADRLARRGYDLILVARRFDRLRRLADKIAGETGRKIEVIAADLVKRKDLAKVEAVLRTDRRITTVVNDAGVASTTPLLQADVDKMSEMIALNVDALTRLTYAAAPGFVERGGGTIINIASAVALAPWIFNGVYGASKAFVLAFSRSLKHELAEKGVRVHVVLPGVTATDLWGTTDTPLKQMPGGIVMPAAAMVDAALVGLDQGEFATLPSLPNVADWDAYEAGLQALVPNLSRAEPAARLTEPTAKETSRQPAVLPLRQRMQQHR
ncbi:SDR family NAD(P)-dependent oxidoreductase [Bradyrhizobium cenepequi]|uniref:SDR family NAD(P)-dependent oxidoreductase n=1 Tax=Bradyrhizobium cenepequi TaxID=2821403 RepID=UPI001CE32198|nr:SDR family oxidoreductase [Bradyrhizobium cenepequi]MCA6111169.1 SDR family oxidoreductase [Bradyrhizobium cenepequi]